MKTKLEFQWREGDLALKAVPKRLVRFEYDEENVTIDFLKYYKDETGRELCFLIGYFKYNERDNYWCLYFVGDRFKQIPPDQSSELWNQLGLAYDVLNDWMANVRNEEEY